MKLRLFTPGPTPLPDRIREALARPIIHHRSEEFQDLLKGLRPRLQKIFGTKQEIMLLSCSGTGGMEACFRSLIKSSESVLVVDAGKFGERFTKLAESYRVQTDVVKIPWGESVKISDLEKNIKPTHSALLIQHSETSTGALHPLGEISSWLKQNHPQVLLIVDGITSIGAMPFEMDSWGVDAAITGSQKAFMCPPGLAMISLSPRAISRLGKNDLPGFYFDLKRELTAIQKNSTAFTPAINIIQALDEATLMMNEEGLENLYRRHENLARATRAACQPLGLKLAARNPGVACTSAFFNPGFDGKAFLKNLKKETGFHFAGAQEIWEGKVIRIAHLGAYLKKDLEEGIEVLATALRQTGHTPDPQRALQVFMETFSQ